MYVHLMHQIYKVLYWIFLLSLWNLVRTYKYDSELLNIDPLSIDLDPNLYRLCWSYIGNSKLDVVKGIDKDGKAIQFQVFKDPESLKERYCIEKRELHVIYRILLPISSDKISNMLPLNVTFSGPLGPQMDIIRFQTVSDGIHFQLDNDFRGIAKSESVRCDVVLLYESEGKESMVQFKMSTVQKNYFQKVYKLSSFYFYNSCTIVDIIDVSSIIYGTEKILYSQEKTDELKPFMPLPMKRFIVVMWQHSSSYEMYNIAIYQQMKLQKEKLVKVFRISQINSFSDCQMETIEENARSDGTIEDLGCYERHQNGNMIVILDMVNPLKMYEKYKLLIVWRNSKGTIGKNYLYFTPFPNENNAKSNLEFIQYEKFSYEELRQSTSSFVQTVFSSHPQNPVLVEVLNKTWHSEVTVLSTVSFKKKMSFYKIPESKEHIIVKDYLNDEEITKGLYPYFYLLSIHRSEQKDVFVELWQVPKHEKISIIQNLELSPNHEDSTFLISWNSQTFSDSVVPSMYYVILKSSDSLSSTYIYRLICRTCNKMYNQIAMDHLKTESKFYQVNFEVINREIEFDATENRFSFTTYEMPTSVNFQVQVFTVTLSKTVKSGWSRVQFLKERFWKKYGNITISVLFGISFIIIIFGLIYIYKKCTMRRYKKEPEVVMKDCNDSLYDED